MSNKPYCQNFPTSSFVVRDGEVIITSYNGGKYMHEVRIPLKDFLKASVVIKARESEEA